MAEMLIVWLLTPLAFLILCYGLGLSVAITSRRPMIATVVAITGFLLLTIVGSLLVISTSTAPYAAGILALISLVSLIYAFFWRREYLRLDKLSLFAGSVTYVAYGLPVIAYGVPRWAGWVKLDDNGTFLAVIDRLMSVGRTVPNPVLSTYQRVLQTIFESAPGSHYSYPVGSLVPLGVISKISTVEAAWLFQPYLSFAAGLTSAMFVILLRSHLKNNKVIFVISVTSVLASTLYSYAMWGAIKELVLLVPLTFLVVTLYEALRKSNLNIYYIYVAIAVLSLFFVGGTAVLGFLAPILFIAFLVKFPTKNRKKFSAMISLIAIGSVGFTYFLRAGNNPIGTFLIPVVGDQGNMVRALKIGQVAGIWPAPDFRMDANYPALTYSLIIIALAFALLGSYFAVKSHKWVVFTLFTTTIIVVANSQIWGGIWLTGKAMAVASPFFLLSTSIGLHEAWKWLRSHEALAWGRFTIANGVSVLATILALGVLSSDLITYKNVWLAPNSQMTDLQIIGKKFAGQGPTLMTEYSVLGSRYFLRKLDAEAASELRVHFIPLRNGELLPKGFAADIDQFDNPTIDYFNLLVIRKSSNASRPPLNYSLAYSGTNYEVWKKNATNVIVRSTYPLGNIMSAGETPTCDSVAKFLSQRTVGERVYIAKRSPNYVVDFGIGALPSNWSPNSPNNGAVYRVGKGGFARTVTVSEQGDYKMFIAGSFPGRVRIEVDGMLVYSGKSVFEANSILTNPIGNIFLSSGTHTFTIDYAAPLLAPGVEGTLAFGPIYLSTQVAGDVKVKAVKAQEIPSLCKQNLDWIAIAR